MTKADLVEEVAKAVEVPKKDAERIVKTVFDSVTQAPSPWRKDRTSRFRQLQAART